ncbi:Pleiotropic drug resistance protein 1 [Platanthera guangdongensis]|uniref:Pleiotropic drug resistance protein 1 n=1 Tax=Platanthera guangdongensis TaxID=2320717 RepID=A0ABR2N347_9ASPA
MACLASALSLRRDDPQKPSAASAVTCPTPHSFSLCLFLYFRAKGTRCKDSRISFYLLIMAIENASEEEAPPRMASAGQEDFPAKVRDTKEEMKMLQERLARAATEDNESFLLRLKQRFQRVGIELPRIEVRFENLSVAAEAYVGSRSSPSFSNAILNTIQSIADLFHLMPSKKRRIINILEDATGIIKPGRLTLLLGPPGSGKTTFLLALAGKLQSDLKVSGKVSYNGHGLEEFVPQRTAAYVDQRDLHIADLTVRETLQFSARCQGVGSHLGEMIVGPIKTLFMDDISTGLDSSTTFQIVNSLRQAIHILGGTAVLSLLQPAPETYELFDDIILLSDGHIVYQGSRTHAPQFFESMGFKCPERKGYADFLQEVPEVLHSACGNQSNVRRIVSHHGGHWESNGGNQRLYILGVRAVNSVGRFFNFARFALLDNMISLPFCNVVGRSLDYC